MDERLFAMWTPDEKQRAAYNFNVWNGSIDDPIPFGCIGDSSWMHYLADRLKQEAIRE